MKPSRSGRARPAAAILGAVAILSAPGAAGAQEALVSVGVSVRAVSGSFGSDQTTRLVYVPAVLRLDSGRFEISGYFPFITIDNGTVAPSEGGLVPMRGSLPAAPNAGIAMTGTHGSMMGGSSGIGAAPSGTGAGAPPLLSSTGARESGLGDVVASVGYRVIDDRVRRLQVVVTGRFKVPTASATSGLGTGELDAAALGAIRKRFDNGWIFGEAGYLFLGDPGDAELRNAVLWTIGTGRQVTDRLYLLASAYGNTRILEEYDSPIEVGAGVGVRLHGPLHLTVVPTVGLSEASPDYGVTIGLTTDLFRR